jgi:hypothetical protein
MTLSRVNPDPANQPGCRSGLTGLPRLIRVRSCILTRDLHRLRLILGQDLLTLHLRRATTDSGEHNWIKQTMHLLFILVVLILIPTTRDGVLRCRCFNPANLPRGTRGRWLWWGSPELELEGEGRDTGHGFIQVRAAKVANPTSCLGYHVWRPAIRCWVGWDVLLGTQSSFI